MLPPSHLLQPQSVQNLSGSNKNNMSRHVGALQETLCKEAGQPLEQACSGDSSREERARVQRVPDEHAARMTRPSRKEPPARAMQAQQKHREPLINRTQNKQSNEPAQPLNKEMFSFLKRRRGEATSKDSNNRGRPDDGPGIDAPISAVNAGDRQVLVACNKASILLPINPTTTPFDLIGSAATCLNEHINPKASVLMESFGKVGVQRPLRKYEHVRNVLNSWDNDRQNTLIILPSATGGNDMDLDSAAVLSERPPGMSCYLYYSQKVGKWDKRWVTLRSDGQVTIAKKESSKDKDITNACHISDFDIYSPSAQKLAKTVKPPKKICFAIKSQQKSSMFESEENFVHFVCTSDKKIGALWYKAVQGWRSWYLVHVLGEGQKDRKTVHQQKDAHGRNESNESRYQLGTFKPLIELDLITSTQATPDTKNTVQNTTNHARERSSQNRSAPPSAFLRRIANEDESVTARPNSRGRDAPNSQDQIDEKSTSAGGPLGRTHSQRRQQSHTRDKSQVRSNSGPYVSIDAKDPDDRPLGLGRARSTRTAPSKPLIDLPAQYHDSANSQPKAKGKGFSASVMSTGGLVDLATTPADPTVAAPPADWRARNPVVSSLQRSSSKRDSGNSRERSQHRTASWDEDTTERNPFNMNGLLATSAGGQGEARHGRGIMSGSNAKGPMVDLHSGSQFTQGSLLAGVERGRERGSPVLDRSKGVEIKIGTGEGF